MSQIFALLILLTATIAESQVSAKYRSNYKQQYYQSLRYGFFKPAQNNPGQLYPLIVYLHGSRDTVSRDMMWYDEEMQKKHPAFVITPKCIQSNQGWGNTWQEGHTEATRKTLALIDSLVKTNPIDRKRIYLYGISMGGFGVFSILAKEQGKFAAAYAICGGSEARAAGKLLSTPLWIFHGAIDDIVPVHLSRDVYNEMIRLGGQRVKYTEYPGVKHNSWENASKEKELPDWLFAQKLK